MKEKNIPVSNLGTVSLVMIFMVLCMTIFSVLSLSGSLSDLNLSKASAKKNQAYYQAETEVLKSLKFIDDICEQTLRDGQELTYQTFEGLFALAHDEDIILAEGKGESATFVITKQINDKLLLEVRVTTKTEGHYAEGFYTIHSWREVPTSAWSGDDTYKLM